MEPHININLEYLQSANKIADHVSKISREIPHLDSESLPNMVNRKWINPESEIKVPLIIGHKIY